MRIMMLAQFYPPLIGGEERFTRDLSVQLAARGHEVSVVTLLQDGLAPFEIDHDVRIYRINGTAQRATALLSKAARRHAAPLPDPELIAQLRRIIARERPDIVHGHNWMAHAFLPLKRWSKARFVMSLHDYSFVCATKKLIYYDETACSGPGVPKCFGCSIHHYGKVKGLPTVIGNWMMSAAERRLVDIFLPVSTAVAEYNGIVQNKLPYQILTPFVPDNIGDVGDVGEMGDAPAEFLAQLPQEPFLLFVGAFGRYKGVDVLLEAHARMDSPPPLVIIGYETAEHPVRTTDLPGNVTVLKNAPRNAIMAAWRRSLLGITPSVWEEPFGIVALEAMACERAVIGTTMGGLKDIIRHEETGLLVPPGDAVALQNAMQRLIADDDLRGRMGAAGKQRLTEFLASTVTPRYEQVYQALLEQPRRSRALTVHQPTSI